MTPATTRDLPTNGAHRPPGAAALKHYLGLIAAMTALLIGIFAVVEALGLTVLTAPASLLSAGGLAAGLLGVGLLAADVLLPVPSSLVMVVHGAAFGFALGASLSLIGSMGASWLGFAVGRRGGRLLERLVPADERRRANDLLERWGPLAVIVTRPVPVLAETVAVLAGTSPLTWRQMTVAALAGSLPACLIYALAGAIAVQTLDSFLLVFAVVLLVPAPLWLLASLRRGTEGTLRGPR